MNFIQAYFISSLRFLNIFIMAVVKSVSCASVKLPLSGNFTIGVLDSGGIILSLLFLFVFLHRDLRIWSYNIYGLSWCAYLVFVV